MVAPELFALRTEDGHSYVLVEGELPASLEDAALKAQMGCPERAIIVEQ
jgi:ferredoxin